MLTYRDEHGMGDMVLGAFLGVGTGQRVVLHNHAHANNRIHDAVAG